MFKGALGQRLAKWRRVMRSVSRQRHSALAADDEAVLGIAATALARKGLNDKLGVRQEGRWLPHGSSKRALQAEDALVERDPLDAFKGRHLQHRGQGPGGRALRVLEDEVARRGNLNSAQRTNA